MQRVTNFVFGFMPHERCAVPKQCCIQIYAIALYRFWRKPRRRPLPHQSCPISSKVDNEIKSIKIYSTPCGEAEQTDGQAICTVHNAAQLDSLEKTQG